MPTLELKPTHKVVTAYYDNTVSLETMKLVKELPGIKFS